MPQQTVQDAIYYLERDVLRNIVPLKMITAFPDAARVHHVSSATGQGVLVLLSASAFDYDRETYPTVRFVALVSSDDVKITRELIEFVPHDEKIVFKLASARDLEVIRASFDLERTRGFLSFTSSRSFTSDAGVGLTLEPSDAVFELFASQGHHRAWLEPLLISTRALACVLEQDGAPVSVCFAFQNYGHVWEIGGVLTAPESRGRGLAGRVVRTALAELEVRGLKPRYQVIKSNTASIRLAESLGLTHFLSIEHWITK
jgi:ribosomal protein S18 acetylase RimI-like enzyme